MEKRSTIITQTGNGVDLAFAVVVLASYLATFSSIREASLVKIILLILLGIVYVNLGIYGYSLASKSQFIWEKLLYFMIQIPIGGLIIYLGGGVGYNALVLLPLAGHSIVLLKSFWLYTANFAIGMAFLVTSRLMGVSLGEAWPNLLTFLAGQVFILVFTQMAIDEQRSRKEVERLVHELQAANDQLRLYAVQVEELTITKERNRLAREIHDGLGHYLTTIHMQLMAGRAVSNADPVKADELFLKAQNMAQEALADIRQSVAALRASPEEWQPIIEQVEKILDGSESLGLHGELSVIGEVRPLPPQVHLTLYRAVQEGVNNTCKHAQAKNIQVMIDFSDPNQISLTIQDDGIGSISTNGGFGLIGLRERVHQLQGEIDFETARDQGFRIMIKVPVKDDKNTNR
jgi:signal transduction histidine kinase